MHPSAVQRSTGPRPPWTAFVFAFAVMYLGYGLNFLAVRIGVEALPPFLFAGAHVVLAGAILAAWMLARGEQPMLPPTGLARAGLAGAFLFVGGVGLVTLGEKLGVPSGVAAIVKASAPLWVAFLEGVRPRGERPTGGMIVGLLVGAAGVVAMVVPRLDPGAADAHPFGISVLVASAMCFAIGTLLVRHWPPGGPVTAAIVWEMLIGGGLLLAIGLARGEFTEPVVLTAPAVSAFVFLVLGHSLGAFTALNWLLRHLPAPIVTTKFYVSPAIAVTAGWLVLGEAVTAATLGALALILGGVAILLWQAGRAANEPAAVKPDDADELED